MHFIQAVLAVRPCHGSKRGVTRTPIFIVPQTIVAATVAVHASLFLVFFPRQFLTFAVHASLFLVFFPRQFLTYTTIKSYNQVDVRTPNSKVG